MTMVMMLMTPIASRQRLTRPAEVGVQPLALATRRRPDGSVALVDLSRDTLEAGDRLFDLIGDFSHFASIGVSGDAAPSSLPWFTPSARAI